MIIQPFAFAIALLLLVTAYVLLQLPGLAIVIGIMLALKLSQ